MEPAQTGSIHTTALWAAQHGAVGTFTQLWVCHCYSLVWGNECVHLVCVRVCMRARVYVHMYSMYCVCAYVLGVYI